MALKISLKPHERLIIGGAVVTNGGAKCELVVENKVPVLRDKDILREKDANTPCKRIYFGIQLMYVDHKDAIEKHNIFWKLVKDVMEAAPSTTNIIGQISQHILNNKYYQALKLAKRLIAYEGEVLARAKEGAGRVSEGN
jgi:flagellar biosynthesis repressor protein FlbT